MARLVLMDVAAAEVGAVVRVPKFDPGRAVIPVGQAVQTSLFVTAG